MEVEEATGYLYAIKLGDAQCMIGNQPFVLCKLGMAVGWNNLMARFKNHQNDASLSLGITMLLPRHGHRGSGEMPLHGKTFADSGMDTVNVGGVDDVVHAMTDEELDSRFREEHIAHGETCLWPDLAYIIPMTADLARDYEAVMRWNLCTYLDSVYLQDELLRYHRFYHQHSTKSRISHRETSLMPARVFARVRELFLANALTSNTMTQLVTKRRATPSPETTTCRVCWTSAAGSAGTINIRYYEPAHMTGQQGLDSLGLLMEATST